MAGGGGNGGGVIMVEPFVPFIPALCRRVDPQDVPTSPAETDVSFQQLDFPLASELVDFSFTAGINPFTILNDGVYEIASGLALKGSLGGTYRDTRLVIDGLPEVPPHGCFDSKAPNGLFHTAHNMYRPMRLLPGWKVGVQVFQNSGETLTVDIFPDSPWLSLVRIK